MIAAATRLDADGGVRIVLRARPKSRPERLESQGGALLLRVAAAPAEGEANARILLLLAARLGVSRRDLELTRGHTARDKELLVRGLALPEVRARLVADEG